MSSLNPDELEHIPRSQIISYSQSNRKPLSDETWSYLLRNDFGRNTKFLDTWKDTYKFFYDRLQNISLTFIIDDLHVERSAKTITCLNQSKVNYTYDIFKNKNRNPIYSSHHEPALIYTLIFKGLRSPEIAKTFQCLLDNKILYYITNFQTVFIPELANILIFIPSHPIISTLFPIYDSQLLDFIEERLYQSDPQFLNLISKNRSNPYITPYLYNLAQEQIAELKSTPPSPEQSRQYLRTAQMYLRKPASESS